MLKRQTEEEMQDLYSAYTSKCTYQNGHGRMKEEK
jgi:hypothetical protein